MRNMLPGKRPSQKFSFQCLFHPSPFCHSVFFWRSSTSCPPVSSPEASFMYVSVFCPPPPRLVSPPSFSFFLWFFCFYIQNSQPRPPFHSLTSQHPPCSDPSSVSRIMSPTGESVYWSSVAQCILVVFYLCISIAFISKVFSLMKIPLQ